jgi:hypothetical protein
MSSDSSIFFYVVKDNDISVKTDSTMIMILIFISFEFDSRTNLMYILLILSLNIIQFTKTPQSIFFNKKVFSLYKTKNLPQSLGILPQSSIFVYNKHALGVSLYRMLLPGLRLYPLNLIRLIPAKGKSDRKIPSCIFISPFIV